MLATPRLGGDERLGLAGDLRAFGGLRIVCPRFAIDMRSHRESRNKYEIKHSRLANLSASA
jgi:hypothetical protein